MIPQTAPQHEQRQQSDRHSVVVLDYPKREQQDIECYCIPSSNLDDHRYVPAYQEADVGDQRDDVGSSQARPSLLSSKPQQSSKRGWGRLWPSSKSIRNLGNPLSSRRLLKSKSTTTAKKQLTEEEMMKYISSQDDLDWSAGDDKNVPANPNLNRQRLSSIVEPLVQIYLEGEDNDDTVSAISQDTCWKDESQGVVELVLPNVLFCDDREDDSDDANDVDNWNILFPSYIEEARENSREERDQASRSGREDVEKKREPSEKGIHSSATETSEDEASISSTGWEDDESESESEKEKEGEVADGSTPQREESADSNPLLTTISPLSETHPAGKAVEEEEEEVVEVQLQVPSRVPSDLFLPSLAPKEHDEKSALSATQPIAKNTITPKEKANSVAEPVKDTRGMYLKRSASAPLSRRKGLFSCAPRRKDSSRSPSPRRRFLKRRQPPAEQPQPSVTPNDPQNVITKESLPRVAPEPTTSVVKEIDVLSDHSLESNLTNPSMLTSTQISPPPSPPKGFYRAQRRGSVTRFSLQQPTLASNKVLTLSPASSSTRIYSIASVVSTAGSPLESVEEDTPIDTTANTGLLSGFWKRVTQIPSFLTRRKGNGRFEESSTAGGSDDANDGDNDNQASWRSNSLGSLGGWSAFKDCEQEEDTADEESSRWWELNTSLIDQVVCGSLHSPATVTESVTSPREETSSPFSDGDSCSSASAAVFEDAMEDEADVVSVSPKPKSQEIEQKAIEDDPWSAAKRGDVDAIRKWTEDKTYDWNQKDEFGNTALFYACHSGAAINISIVKILLDQWPVEDIPADVLDRCKTNALNRSVVKMLEHPDEAEEIISSVFREYLESNNEMTDDDDDESYHLTKWLLYDLEEGDEEGDY